MSKYIIELDDRIKLVTSVGVTENGVVYTTSDYVHNLEELNSDYINENFGGLQDEAYQRGINDGSLDVKQRVEGAYQRGLEDAWEATKKIALMDTETSENVTGYFGLFRIMENLTAMQAIEKLKAYEDSKHSDRIEVGDEVIAPSGKAFVTATNNSVIYYLYSGGDFGCTDSHSLKKTGKHYDIQSILEAMRE